MFNESIISLYGIGKQRNYFFNKLDIFTKRDLLFFLPFQYLKISEELKEGYIAIQVIVSKKSKFSNKFFRIIVLFNETEINLNFFNIKFFNIFYKNQTYYICGELYKKDDKYYMDTPNILNSPSRIIPMYKGVSSYLFSNIIMPLIDKLDNAEIIYKDYTVKKIFFNLHNGMDVNNSLYALKYLEASFLFDVFSKDNEDNSIRVLMSESLKNLPYELSSNQYNLCQKIEKKLKDKSSMKYFVYGEVGAGKTIVSILAMLMVVEAGYTVVLLVPTITLAHQHYEEIIKVVPNLSEQILLLTGLSKSKKKLKENIANDEYKIIVGTHALMYLTELPNVGLIIIDEIHKFGVLQRSKLVGHAKKKNVLMLTATPIPRSLSIMVSNLMEYDMLPSFKEKKIQTIWVNKSNMYDLLEKFRDKKVYWVMPNILENEKNEGIEVRVKEFSEVLKNVFMLHGKMKGKEKLDVIEKFKEEKIAILVATTIIEIGINIPDADIVVIENAENFGLSQLHQLRGRVGRMGQESYCILVSEHKTKKIDYMKKYDNGFEISQKDMELRGSGKITGYLQHGCTSFYFLKEDDGDILEEAIKDKKTFKAFNLFSNQDIGC